MRFIDDIFSFVWDISDFFYNAYLEVKGWIVPFSYLKTPLYALYGVFWDMLTPIAQLGDWADDVAYKVGKILSKSDILAFLSSFIDYASWAWDWVSNAWAIVFDIVNSWWSSTSQTVQVWVNDAKLFAQSLVATVSTALSTLQTSWDAFKTRIPTIENLILWWSNWRGFVTALINTWWTGVIGDVQGLINSAFVTREGLWAGWQDIKAKVLEFFTDPLEFLWARFTDWFLGPEG